MSKKVRVAAKSPASFLIPKDQKIAINYELDGSPIQLHFRTRYLQWGFSTLVPGDLWLDAVGDADRLDIAVSRFTNAGRAMAEIMALCANACTALLEPEVAFELAHTGTKREYFQRLVTSDGFAYTSRFLDIESAIAIIGSIARNAEKDRIMRSVSHYSEALRNWGMGNELRTLCQLFLGIEAIKTVSWRFEAVALGLSKEELARKWGYDEKLRLTLDAFMDSHARVNLIFKGDKDLHKAAKAVSDSFEHGYENFSALYRPAGQALVKTAACLREEIVRVTGADASARAKILGDQFVRPKGKAAQDTYIKGTLVGEADDPAASGTTYPYLDWENKLTNISFDEETQKYTFKPNMQFKANLAEGVAITDIRFEIWDGSFFMPDQKWPGAV